MAAIIEITGNDRVETVKIDGEEYNLTSFDDYTPTEQFQIRKTGKLISEFARKEELTDDELETLEAAVTGMFTRIAGNIPDEVRNKLKSGAKDRIVTAYFLAYAKEGALEEKALSLNGQQESFLNSPDSTEETPNPG